MNNFHDVDRIWSFFIRSSRYYEADRESKTGVKTGQRRLSLKIQLGE